MKSTVSCIYEIVSLSGKRYIGGTVYWGNRKSTHLYYLRRGAHHCLPLQAAYNKYGEDGLSFNILFICERDQVRYWEQIALDNLRNEYNIALYAEDGGGMEGRRHSEESKRLIGKANKGADTSKAVEASVAVRRGKSLSKEHKAKLSKALKGRRSPTKGMKFPDRKSPTKSGFTGKKHSEESKAKMRAAKRRRRKKDS